MQFAVVPVERVVPLGVAGLSEVEAQFGEEGHVAHLYQLVADVGGDGVGVGMLFEPTHIVFDIGERLSRGIDGEVDSVGGVFGKEFGHREVAAGIVPRIAARESHLQAAELIAGLYAAGEGERLGCVVLLGVTERGVGIRESHDSAGVSGGAGAA